MPERKRPFPVRRSEDAPRTVGSGFRYSAPPENQASAALSTRTPPATNTQSGGAHQQHDEERAAEGQSLQKYRVGHCSSALAVDFYNNRRPHISIGMMTPMEASESTGGRDMRWMSYRHLAIKSRDNLDTPENSLPLPER